MYFSFPTAVAQSIELIVIRSIRLSRKGQDDIPSRHHTHTHQDDVPPHHGRLAPAGMTSHHVNALRHLVDVSACDGRLVHAEMTSHHAMAHLHTGIMSHSVITDTCRDDILSNHRRLTHTGMTSHHVTTDAPTLG